MIGRQAMKYTDFLNVVSRTTDTTGTEINVADTKRVATAIFSALSQLTLTEALKLISDGTKSASQKRNEELSARIKRELKKLS